jgi:predicted lipid-binding transport protein (Tim44 family)
MPRKKNIYVSRKGEYQEMAVSRTKMIVTAVLTTGLFLTTGFVELTEARSRGGGRSFRSSPSTSKPAAKQSRQTAAQPTTPRPGGFFGSGLAGGIMGGVMGGVLGSMLFGGAAHAGGGLGGSGIGFFEILLFAGIGFFLFRWLSRRRALASGYEGGAAPDDPRSLFSGTGTSAHRQETQVDDPLVAGVKQIWAEDESFHPDEFKEQAQDMFFKIQAGWTRRDASVLVDWVGSQLLGEYDMHFAKMKEKGEINRLENISVRKVDLLDAGVQDGEMFVVVRFTANLLDYTVEESTGRIIKGDSENPVKFEEEWTFARPLESSQWKLEGIQT